MPLMSGLPSGWPGILWLVLDASMVTLGLVHLGIWARDRSAWQQLFFSMIAFTSAAASVCELALMGATGINEFAHIQSIQQIFITLLAASITGFVRVRTRSTQFWLPVLALVLRVATLIANFTTGLNIHFTEILSLDRIEFLGSFVTVVSHAVPNPWFVLSPIANVVLLAFIVSAMVTAWQCETDRNQRFFMGVVGTLMIAFIVSIALVYVLVDRGVLTAPYAATPAAVILIIAMGYELGQSILRAEPLAKELTKVNRELRTTTLRMEQTAQAGGLGTWEVNFKRDDVWLMKSARTLLGLTPDAPIGTNYFLKRLFPDLDKVPQAALIELIQSGWPLKQEQHVGSEHMNERIIQSSGHVETDPDVGLVLRGISIDVTERRLAEERFRMVFELAPCGLFIVGADGLIELANSKASMDFGYSNFELIGREFGTLIPERFRLQNATSRAELLARSETASKSPAEMVGLHRDGKEILVSTSSNTVRTPLGMSIVIAVEDISERAARLASLTQERAFLRQIIDISPNLIYAKDRHGRFMLANQAVADMYGVNVDAMIGKTDADLNRASQEFESLYRFDLEVMDTLSERLLPEVSVVDAMSNTRWLQLVKRPLLNTDGTSDLVLVSAVDITQKKRTDLELSRQRSELEHLSRVTMLSELSGSIAHELNQPLTAILSNAQAASRFLAVESPDLDEVRAILRDIVSDDRRAGEAIKGLRMLLKKGELTYELVDLNLVTKEVLRLLNSDMLNAGVQLTTHFTSALPPVPCNRVQLQQILLNLLLNGCDSMSGNLQNQRQLSVTTKLAGNDGVLVIVSDSGSGVAVEDLDRIFDPFFTTKAHGLGLGLSVCRQLVTAHEGRLWAFNKADGGASFCFTLPVTTKAAR